MSGLTATGFDPRLLADIMADIEADEQAGLGAAINLGGDSLLGQFNGVMADKVAEIWELAAAVYDSQYPSTAVAAALDAICEITGVTRLPATKSTATVTCGGVVGTLIPAGSIIKTATGSRFATLADANIGAGGTVDVACEATVTGPVAAPAATLTVIETPVGGWNTATNALDAILGTDVETDAALRVRRKSLLRDQGAGTVDAMVAGLLAVAGVTAARVFENTGGAANPDGVPGHAFEAVVLGGADQDVLNAIWALKPMGIEAYGGTAGNVVDSQGFNQALAFSRPTDVLIYIDVTVSTDAALFPVDGALQIQQALVAYAAANIGIGDDVVYAALFPVIFGVAGVLDITVLKVDIVTPPVASANVAITNRQVARFDTARITVTVA